MKDDLYKLYWSLPTFACYEGEGDDGDGGGGDGDGGNDHDTRVKTAQEEAQRAQAEAERKAAAAREAAEEAERVREKNFSQDDLNRFLADDRRKHQEKYKKLEESYKEILADKNLQKEQRAKMEAELADLQKSFRTKEQQAEYERKQERERFEGELETYKTAATKWESLYKNSVIDRSLQDAAVAAEAFNPGQIVGLLRPMTKMQEKTDEAGKSLGDFIPLIDFPDIDEKTGDQVITLRTPEEAVQRMKELPEMFGNLFKANVVSGVGSGSATGGVQSGDGGRVDPTKLTPEQYRKLRRENPEALGLKRRPN
jgi:superfamily II RNA helicase